MTVHMIFINQKQSFV